MAYLGTRYTAAAVSGVATISINKEPAQTVAVTCVPTSASGTGTVTGRPRGVDTFGPVYRSDGTAYTFDLSAQEVIAFSNEQPIEAIKVTSDNSADTFTLVWAP